MIYLGTEFHFNEKILSHNPFESGGITSYGVAYMNEYLATGLAMSIIFLTNTEQCKRGPQKKIERTTKALLFHLIILRGIYIFVEVCSSFWSHWDLVCWIL